MIHSLTISTIRLASFSAKALQRGGKVSTATVSTMHRGALLRCGGALIAGGAIALADARSAAAATEGSAAAFRGSVSEKTKAQEKFFFPTAKTSAATSSAQGSRLRGVEEIRSTMERLVNTPEYKKTGVWCSTLRGTSPATRASRPRIPRSQSLLRSRTACRDLTLGLSSPPSRSPSSSRAVVLESRTPLVIGIHPHTAPGLAFTGKSMVEEAELYKDEAASSVAGIYVLGCSLCGHSGLIHGGVTAMALDDTFGLCYHQGMRESSLRPDAGRGFTANLDVNYRKPLPCAQRVVVHARIERVEGRKVYMAGCVTDQSGETKYAESKALFIVAGKPGDQKATK